MTPAPRTRLLLLALIAIAGATRLTGIGPLAADTPAPPPAVVATTPTDARADAPATPEPVATTPQAAVGATTPTTPATRPQDAAAAAAGTVAADRARTPGAPLRGAVTEPDLPTFERASVALINLEHATDAPVTPMARTAHRACARLDRDVPLLAALRSTCRDTIVAAKLSRVLGRRCADTSDRCARTAARLADAADGLVDARRAYARAIRRAIAPNACRAALLPTHDDLVSEHRLATALHRIADAAAARDPQALAAAGAQLTRAANHSTTDGRTATAVITQLRAACWLPRYPDPVG